MEEKFEKVMNENCVREFLKILASSERYSNITIPKNISNNYCIGNNYALFLFVDSLVKYIIIIEDMKYLNGYVDDLTLIFKKMNSYNDINKGVNTLLAKYVSKILRLSSVKSSESKEKVLRYIYKKYILDGYFYYGYNSSSAISIRELGLQKDGFVLDSRLEEINNTVDKLIDGDIFYRKKTSITDNFVIAFYYSLIAPRYLEDLAKFINSDNNISFYVRDVDSIKSEFIKVLKKKKLPSNRINLVIDNFIDKFIEDKVLSSHGDIAFIKRDKISKNYLKDIEEIFNEVKDLKLYNAIGMILESRYMSFDIESDIAYNDLIIARVPSFKYLTTDEEENIEKLELLQEDYVNLKVDSDDNNIQEEDKNMLSEIPKVDSYGYSSVLMFFGLIFISIGVILSIIFYGG